MNNSQKEMLQMMYSSYSQRDEHRLGTAVSLITGTLAVFGAYATLFIKVEKFGHEVPFALNHGMTCVDLYTVSLLGLTIVADLLLSLFFFVSLNFGYTSAKEHVLLHLIQKEYGINGKPSVADNLCSPKNVEVYSICSFIPDFYQGLCVYSMAFQLIISIATALRLACWWPLAVVLLFFLVQCGLYVCVYRKYKRHLGR